MSREKVREAIGDVERWISALTDGRSLVDEETCRTIAAARAYACERCGGCGSIVDDCGLRATHCPDCADYRKIAGGGEV